MTASSPASHGQLIVSDTSSGHSAGLHSPLITGPEFHARAYSYAGLIVAFVKELAFLAGLFLLVTVLFCGSIVLTALAFDSYRRGI